MDLGELTGDVVVLGAFAAALTAIGVLLRTVVVNPLKKWIKSEMTDLLDKRLTEQQEWIKQEAVVRLERHIDRNHHDKGSAQ